MSNGLDLGPICLQLATKVGASKENVYYLGKILELMLS